MVAFYVRISSFVSTQLVKVFRSLVIGATLLCLIVFIKSR